MSQCLRNIGNKSELTKKEAGQTDEIFLSPRNKSFQNSNSNRRTCFFFSLFLASPIWDLENFPTFLYSLKKKQVERTEFLQVSQVGEARNSLKKKQVKRMKFFQVPETNHSKTQIVTVVPASFLVSFVLLQSRT